MANCKRAESMTIGDAATWYCGFTLLALLMLSSLSENRYSLTEHLADGSHLASAHRRCEEIYVVGEGETLHTISDKCGDPFIVERNPHIHDPDDVFPGLVIMIAPSDRARS
ncbi:hypothetical protein NMG60_11022958 [Bertholletia excelsa]